MLDERGHDVVFERGGFRPNEGHIHVCERPSHRPQYRRPALVHLTEEKKETKQKKKKISQRQQA